MKNILQLSVIIFFLASCAFHTPEFRGDENFKLEKIDGKTIQFNAGAKVYNGNWFGVKIKPSMLDLYVEDQFIGKVHLDKKVKMKSKRETDLSAPFTAQLEDGAMLKLLKHATKSEINVRLRGKVKAGVFIFSKKFEMDETKTIPGNVLKLRN